MHVRTVKDGGILLEYVRKNFSLTNTKSKHLLESGMIVVNDKIITHHAHLLKAGDKICFESKPQKASKLHFHLGFPILYEDESVIVIVKPEGLLTVATEKVKNHTAYFKLTEYVRSKDPSGKARVFIVHRIDRDASGILVFAKTEKAKMFLQENWKKFEKKYYAVVEGTPNKTEGTIKSYLVEDKFRRVYSAKESKYSKYAATRYQLMKSSGKYSLLEVTLLTGRKNQIRVHLADIGHPIIGDEKYGSKSDPAGRLGLHAYCLKFHHPETGEKKLFTSELPDSLKKLIKVSATS